MNDDMRRDLESRHARPSLDLGAGAAHLVELARLANLAGAPEIAGDAAALGDRLAEGRFYVACIGQFKRGKSTLLNALIGRPLLPAGIVPITTAVTVLRFGTALRARVRLGGDWQDIVIGDLAAYVSEEQNPSNHKGVSLVEIFVPSPLLERGMCLVDTPGIGSVVRANTDVTRQFVPQIDAALVVLGVDPPISGEELGLVEETAAQVDALLFVMSKADRSTDAERAEAIAFTRKILVERLNKDTGPLLQVSAIERLNSGRASGDWAALEQTLRTLSESTGSALLGHAAARGLERIAERLLHDVDEQHNALTRPIVETERHVEALRTCAADGERALHELGFLFAAEQKRLVERFAAELSTFVAQEVPVAQAELIAALPAIVGRRDTVRRGALSAARAIADRSVTRWLLDTEPIAEALYRQAAERFATLANDLLQRLASDGGLATLPRHVTPDLGFRTKRRFVPKGMMNKTTRRPGRWLLDTLRTPAAARRATQRDACAFLATLIRGNAGRVTDDFDARVIESRRRLESDIRAALEQITASAERALTRARERHASGREAVHAELARLEALRHDVERLRLPSEPSAHATPDRSPHAPIGIQL